MDFTKKKILSYDEFSQALADGDMDKIQPYRPHNDDEENDGEEASDSDTGTDGNEELPINGFDNDDSEGDITDSYADLGKKDGVGVEDSDEDSEDADNSDDDGPSEDDDDFESKEDDDTSDDDNEEENDDLDSDDEDSEDSEDKDSKEEEEEEYSSDEDDETADDFANEQELKDFDKFFK